MPDSRRTAAPTGAGSRTRVLLSVLALVVVIGGAAVALDRLAATGPEDSTPVSQRTSAPPTTRPPVVAALPDGPDRSALGQAPPALALPGAFPANGPGNYRFARGRGDVAGETGELLRYRVAVEDGTDEDPAAVADFVRATLGNRRGWTAGGDLRLQQVGPSSPHDFTVYLVTTGTAERMCAQAGLDVVGSGLPEGGVSCRTTGRVVLNLARWRLSVPHYVDAEVPLAVYRQMLVNHEVGHELGYGHEACPGEGEPAPVMQQQSIDLDGCEANPWPYLDGSRYTGPQVP